MAINFNGTILPTNIDAVIFNGTAVSKVMFNGVEVWAKAASSLKWSGNSLMSNTTGIEVSGNLFRASFFHLRGAWITAQSDGTFMGDSSLEEWYGGVSLSVSGNLVRIKMSDEAAGAWVTYTAATKKFTGASQSGFVYTDYAGFYRKRYHVLQTSGGLIRFQHIYNGLGDSGSGAYISLT